MKKQLILVPLMLGLGAAVAWRVHAQDAYRHAPSGGSTTVEGIETSAASKTGGRLVEVLVREGDRVAAGDPIARLDCADARAAMVTIRSRVDAALAQLALAEAGSKGARDAAVAARAQVRAIQSQVETAEIARRQAEHEKSRAATLVAQDAAPTKQLDDASYAADTAGEQVAAARASVRAARLQSGAAWSAAEAQRAQIAVARTGVQIAEAEVHRAQLAIDECTVAAPIAGVVADRLHEPGAVVAAGMPIVTILDTRTVTATFFLPDAELGRVATGAAAQLRVDAYPGQVFTGTVRRIADEAEFTPRNVQTREDRDRLVYAVDVEVDNPDGTLRAGMPGEVTIPGTGR
jgi:HlyD family secretion protein